MNERREPQDESLDELLRRADWPAMDPAARQRLRDTWRESFNRPRLAWRPFALAGAAAVACAALGGWWVLRDDRRVTIATGPVARVVQPVVALDVLPRGKTREPQLFERFVVATARPPTTLPAKDAAGKSDEQSEVRAMLASRDARELNGFLELVLRAESRAGALRVLRDMSDPPVDALLAQLANPHVERRFAAARALGEVCRPDVVERLWRMAARDVQRREALAALMHCRNPRAARYLAAAREDPGLESQLRSVRQQMDRIF